MLVKYHANSLEKEGGLRGAESNLFLHQRPPLPYEHLPRNWSGSPAAHSDYVQPIGLDHGGRVG